MVRLLISVCSVFLFSVMGSVLMFEEESHDESQRKQLWKQVEDAEKKSLPKTAIDLLVKIHDSAIVDKDYPEAVRALARKYFLEGQINQPMIPHVIRSLSADMESLPDEIQPVMKTILANWFFAYYQQNRWRFAQRSQTNLPPSEDFETWDLPQLLTEIDSLFQGALQSADPLKKIPISDYDDLIFKGNVDDKHRPTLYDFIAFQALDFYTLDEQITRGQGAWDLKADSPVFGPIDSFLAWRPKVGDDGGFLFRAVQLYQDLLRFHLQDNDPSARLDADLHRLTFAYQAAVGSEKTARYQSALKRFVDAHLDHPLSAIALASLAGVAREQDDWVKAHELASQGLARHPDSRGGNQCFNLIQQIEARDMSVSTERVWNAARPTIDVTYRNIDAIHFRLLPFDYLNWRWGDFNRPDNMRHEDRLALLKQKPIAEWTSSLPKTDDYQRKLEQLPAKMDLPSGCYLLLASSRGDFDQTDNMISICEVWISSLAVVMRSVPGETEIKGQVLDAISGEPIAGAQVDVSAWVRDGRNSKSQPVGSIKTDAGGQFSLGGRKRYHHRILVQHDDQRFGLIDRQYRQRHNNQVADTRQTVLFTDRSLYRPGQTIQFKGICLLTNTAVNRYQVIPDQSVTVVLRDANNQEVERQKFRCNSFGSFSGSFTAPPGRVTGQMRLQVEKGPAGAGYVRVEEYKRPKFFVELEKPDRQFRLNDAVTVTGKASAYTQAAIDDGKVVWRVVREVRYPQWWLWRCWWNPPPMGESQEIANGTSETKSDGTFQVKFEARPDLSVPRESEPVFTYTVYVDVTDSSGETRSDSQQVRIGYTSLQAELVSEDWQTVDKPVAIKLMTSTLDGEGLETEGRLKIYQLEPPATVKRTSLSGSRSPFADVPNQTPPRDLSRIAAWPLGEIIEELEVTTGGDGQKEISLQLKTGAYRAVFETTDESGQKVTAEKPLLVVDPRADRFDVRVPHYFSAEKWKLEPGDELVAVWGTGYASGQAFVELEHRGKVFRSFWTDPQQTQASIRQEISEEFRGGFTVRVTFVRENRAYVETRFVDVPWTNKQLKFRWERFVSKLPPGGRQSWSLAISGPDAKQVAAEMVATMYDASLDAFAAHSWPASLEGFYRDRSRLNLQFQNYLQQLQGVVYNWRVQSRDGTVQYRYFPGDIAPGISNGSGRLLSLSSATAFGGAPASESALGIASPRRRGGGLGGRGQADEGMMADAMIASAETRAPGSAAPVEKSASPQAGPGIDLSNVSARSNLQETAFFFPHLTADDSGVVRIEFEMPEALTKWKFMSFAHDPDLRTALLTEEVVTSKDLMVQPNPPRFLREGDLLEFSVKVSNQSATRQTGSVRLTLADARTGESMDAEFSNTDLDQAFEIAAGQSQSLFWKLKVPDFVGVLTYKAVGATDRLSDGEEGFLPVLSRRILVTESLPLPIRGKQTRQFEFDRLRKSADSDTLQSQSLTLQMTSNPAWYAVMALPYLMEYPHDCSEQVFNRLYANALGKHIANSDPKIKRVFDQWRGTDALDSPLEKNDELRNVMIAESPWLLAAKKESKARRDVAVLFDTNRLDNEIAQASGRLSEMQYSDGAWPWFPGGRANDFITLYVTTGFGRLRHLGVQVDIAPAVKSLDRLDHWVYESYQEILRKKTKDKEHLSATVCLYLYGRSFFLQDQPIDDKYRTAVDYFLQQARQHWPTLQNRQSQGHAAIALKRFGDLETPQAIMASLTERSIDNEEMGMLWRDKPSWWWYHAPIETQAIMIEAYDEVSDNQDAVESCKVWLLKQKQTQNWPTTKSTADACYALLLRGTNLLASSELVEVKLGDVQIEPDQIEAGTGFYEHRFVGAEITPAMGQITVTKQDDGVAWGGLHWQYLEDVGKIEAYEGTPLTVKKGLFTKKNSEKGPLIEPLSGPVKVGDELVTRVELRVDRDMEYVHLKDYRGSGTEPTSVLSRYRFQDGLAYYESTRDTATHFFIDYLPRGTYVFEYSVRVQHRGQYQTGIATLQCMYAPEFNSHSGSVEVVVR